MAQKTFSTNCPHCSQDILITADIPECEIPQVRSNLNPVGNITVYRITSEQIKDFINKKAKQFVPDVRTSVAPRYCERKAKNGDPHRAYASLRIAFSESVVQDGSDLGWYGKIAESASNVKIHAGVMKGLIDRYKYNERDVQSWLKNYKTLEALEYGFGMTEKFIEDIKMYTTPVMIKDNNSGENWIIVSAAPENVIADMLSDPTTDKPFGRIQIQNVQPISTDIVEFIIYVHPAEITHTENPHVRQILLGDQKPKKK